MDRTAWNGRSASARLLALFAVLVGLLAMHGLASSHHGPASAAERPSGPAERHAAAGLPTHVAPGVPAHAAAAVQAGPVAAVQAHDVTAAPAHHGATPAAAPAPQLTRPLSAPTGPSCDGDCPTGLVVLCVAVLAAAAVATAVLLRRRARLPRSGRAVSPVRAPTAARHAPPPPDPVRELCVSRT